MPDILVTYATHTGTTQEVAEAIRDVLAADGTAVDLREVSTVGEVAPYRAVVVGSAIQNGKWLPEAVRFIQANQGVLAGKPVATFITCISLVNATDPQRTLIEGYSAPIRTLLTPVREGTFAGALHLDKIPSFWNRQMCRLNVVMGAWKSGDHRDWDVIRAWAAEVKPLLA